MRCVKGAIPQLLHEPERLAGAAEHRGEDRWPWEGDNRAPPGVVLGSVCGKAPGKIPVPDSHTFSLHCQHAIKLGVTLPTSISS